MRATCFLIVALALVSCATPYQPRGLTGGFSETQLGENIFRVSFSGNGNTSSERAEDFALLRSAEIALDHGFTHFIVVAGRAESDIETVTTPTKSVTNGTTHSDGNAMRRSSTTTTYGGHTYAIRRPSAINTIVCFRAKPEMGGLVFDAQFLVNSLSEKYQIAK